jgi:hypothetical protein
VTLRTGDRVRARSTGRVGVVVAVYSLVDPPSYHVLPSDQNPSRAVPLSNYEPELELLPENSSSENASSELESNTSEEQPRG